MLGAEYREFLEKFNSIFFREMDRIKKNLSDARMGGAQESFFVPVADYIKGGKRIRPYLISVAAGNFEEETLQACVAFEILHTFILIHDDIMDGAVMRRGVPTAHVAFGEFTEYREWGAMLLGDFLMAAANEHMAKYASGLSGEFYEMQRLLILGQYYEMLHWGKEVSESESANIEYFKSAQYTFMYPLRLGLMLSGNERNLLDEYAKYAGLAFQMRDDWLDVEGDSGKDKGLDTENGVPNVVQQLFAKRGGDANAVKGEVVERLEVYHAQAIEALEKAEISQKQKKQLEAVVEFCVRI